MKRTRLAIKPVATAALASLVAFAPASALACAMCGLPAGDHAIHAYNSSVLFMMIAPYSIVAASALCLYIAYRNARSRRRRLDAANPSADAPVKLQ